MWEVSASDGNAAIAVLETPDDAVKALHRVDTRDPAMVPALMGLGPERLRDLNVQTRTALRQVRRNGKPNDGQGLSSALGEAFKRAIQFGD